MPDPTVRLLLRLGTLLTVGACGHSDAFTTPEIDPQGPFSTAARAQLTFNGGADNAPSWTADGRGIIYTFAEPGRADHDRCLAILPAAGGTRLFTLCDNRPGHADSAETITSGALSTDGKLIYLVGASLPIGQLPSRVTLFLADTITPLIRQTLLTLPVQLGGGLAPTWLSDIAWVASDQFLALAQEITLLAPCPGCARDTVLTPLAVVRGTISATGATLQMVAGTEGARGYSLAEGGSSIVFSRGLAISKLPVAGGAITPVLTLGAGIDKRIDDVSCRGTGCVINVYEVFSTGAQVPGYQLFRIATTGGAATVLATTNTDPWAAVRLSPTGTDAVVRVGPYKTGDLFLFRNLLP